MSTPRDSQRQKVYDAERFCFDQNEKACYRFADVKEAQRFVNRVTGSKFWKTYETPQFMEAGYEVTATRERKIKVLAQANRKYWSTAGYRYVEQWGGFATRTAVINLAQGWGFDKWVVLHELTHHLCRERPAHGRAFCKAYLDIVGRFLGSAAKADLKIAFRMYGVKYSRPRKDSKSQVIAATRQRKI